MSKRAPTRRPLHPERVEGPRPLHPERAKRVEGPRGGPLHPERAKRVEGPTIHVSVETGRVPAALRVKSRHVSAIARAALAAEGVERGELSVLVTRDPTIRMFNEQFRGKDTATNVLSFPQDDPRSGGLIGDVIVSVDTVARQGAETGAGFAYTFDFYLVHGILHLLGYDHHTGGDAKKMYARTREILSTKG